jgi:hypothetical protein
MQNVCQVSTWIFQMVHVSFSLFLQKKELCDFEIVVLPNTEGVTWC